MSQFSKIGYQKFKIDKKNIHLLNLFKDQLKKLVKKELSINDEIELENIHNFNFKENDFNSFRLSLFNKINNIQNINQKVFNIYSSILYEMLGPDISVQKKINLSIQRPNDQERAPLHRDSPPNSPYEIVVWLPLVNCIKDMSMYLFDINEGDKIDSFLNNDSNMTHDEYSKKNAECCECEFGELLIFAAPAFHYIPINTQKHTRWAINIRYKNTFSPYGMKGFLDFFEPLTFSSITKLALKNE